MTTLVYMVIYYIYTTCLGLIWPSSGLCVCVYICVYTHTQSYEER